MTRSSYLVLRIPIKDIGTGLVYRSTKSEALNKSKPQMTKDSIKYYTLQCEVWLDISAGG